MIAEVIQFIQRPGRADRFPDDRFPICCAEFFSLLR